MMIHSHYLFQNISVINSKFVNSFSDAIMLIYQVKFILKMLEYLIQLMMD